MYCDGSHCARQFQFKGLLIQSCLSSWLIASDGLFSMFSLIVFWKHGIFQQSQCLAAPYFTDQLRYVDNYVLFLFWKSHLTVFSLPSCWQSWLYKYIYLPLNVLFPGEILLDNICIGFLTYFPAVFLFSFFFTILGAVG